MTSAEKRIATLCAAVESAHACATDTWHGATWRHDAEVDEDSPHHGKECWGAVPGCDYCARVQHDAECAEWEGEQARHAVKHGHAPRFAIRHATAAAALERKYGDSPAWGGLLKAVRAWAAAVGPQE